MLQSQRTLGLVQINPVKGKMGTKGNKNIGVRDLLQENKEKVASTCDQYMNYYNTEKDNRNLEKKRCEDSSEMTKGYFDIATDFYEYGWGESFHFAPLKTGEPMVLSLAKHEYKLAVKLEMKPGMKILDIGCGVGGPARHLAELSGANIIGLNYSGYQIERCRLLTKQAGLEKLCQFIQGDFCDIPLEDEEYDGAYAIEAVCHAADRKVPFREIFRILKPGSMFALYDWIMTNKYDPDNEEHNKIRNDIMIGNSLPHITGIQSILTDLKAVGFEVLEERDFAGDGDSPWWVPLAPTWTLSGFRSTWIGRWCTHIMLMALETFGMAPKGSVKVHNMLCIGADGLWKGGKLGIFTTVHFVLARKPVIT